MKKIFKNFAHRITFLFGILCLLNVSAQGYTLDAGGVNFKFLNVNRTTAAGPALGLAGSAAVYTNIATVNTKVLYGKITVVALDNATINTFDNDPGSADDARFQPVYTVTGVAPAGGFISYKLEFFDTATNFPVYLKNFYFNGIDVDSEAAPGVSNIDLTEVYRIPNNEYSVRTLSNSTQLAISQVGSDTQFRGSGFDLNGVTFENTASFYLKYIDPKSSISFKIGANGAMSNRETGVKIGVNGSFTGPTTDTPSPGPKVLNDLQISKTVNILTATAGTTVEFTITATNNGLGAATNVKVGDKLPAGYTYVSKTLPEGNNYNQITGVWTIGNLASSGTRILKIKATVNSAGALRNEAGISGNETEANTANNTASATVALDSDGDGIADGDDVDDDNDGILDIVENSACDIPEPTLAAGNGYIINTLFKEDFGTQSLTAGTTSVTLPGVGTNATTTYNYYNAIAGTVPTNPADGPSSPNFSLQDGRYTVFNNIQQVASFASSVWQNLGDHTGGVVAPGTGRMFIVNASLTVGEFYRKVITGIVQGAPLNASLWAMNLDKDIPSNSSRILPNITINFIQGGSTVFTFNTGDLPRTADGNLANWKFFKNATSFIPTSDLPIEIVLINNAPGGNGNDLAIDDIIVYQSFCDTDNDGIPNYLDLDSDNDGCLDAIEGAADIKEAQLVNAGGSVSVGTGSTAFNQNLCASGNCVNTQGLPQLAPLPTNYNNTTGQGVGSSANAAVNACICYNDAAGGTGVQTNHGITLLQRAGGMATDWPMLRKSAHIVLESNTKGFVITRMTTTQINNIVSPQEGMMVFDTLAKCLKINSNGTPGAWNCFTTPTCP